MDTLIIGCGVAAGFGPLMMLVLCVYKLATDKQFGR